MDTKTKTLCKIDNHEKMKLIANIIRSIHCGGAYYFFKYLCRGKILNSGNIIDPPFIIAPNHVSYMDWSILHWAFRSNFNIDIRFIAKKKLFDSRYFKYVTEYGRAICVDQDNVNKEFLREVKDVANMKKVIGIFPEGTRTESGKLIKAFPGVGKIALLTGLPVIPIGLNGFYEMLPRDVIIPRITKATINIGKPIFFCKKDINAEEYTKIIMQEIAKLTNQEYSF